jgi:hypothetical protein
MGTTLLGQISTGSTAIAGMTLSPDGTGVYVTSEIAASSIKHRAAAKHL